jgi:hypothetical protein
MEEQMRVIQCAMFILLMLGIEESHALEAGIACPDQPLPIEAPGKPRFGINSSEQSRRFD